MEAHCAFDMSEHRHLYPVDLVDDVLSSSMVRTEWKRSFRTKRKRPCLLMLWAQSKSLILMAEERFRPFSAAEVSSAVDLQVASARCKRQLSCDGVLFC